MLSRIKHIVAFLACCGTSIGVADARDDMGPPSAPLLNAPYITGTHYSARDLLPVYLEEVGQPVTGERLEAIARRIEQMYRRDGFLIPLIVTEGAAGSTPHLHVFEARVHEVRVRGDAGVHKSRVDAVAAHLESQPVLHKGLTQRAIHELEALPGLSVRTALDPVPGNPNQFALTLRVQHQRTEASVAATSRVSDELGDALLSGRVAFNGLLNMHERISLTAASSSTIGNYAYVSGRIEKLLGHIALAVSASHAQANTRPESDYESQRYTIEASTSLLHGSGLVVRPLLALSARNARHEDEAGDPWNFTRTRTLQAGVELSLRDEGRVSRLRTAGERGLDKWNAATYRRSGMAPEVEFTKVTLDASHAQVLVPGWQLRASLEGQWTRADLPPGERFTYGGSLFGRAFDPGALIADRGAAASLQIDRYRQWRDGWIDYGRAWLQADYGIGEDNGNVARGTLRGASMSAGVSGRIEGLTTSLELGYALQRKGFDPQAGKLRMFISTQYAF